MAAADVQAHLVAEIEAQAVAAITQHAESTNKSEWNTATYRDISHDNLTVVWKGRSRTPHSNEADMVTHRIDVEMTTKGESRETVGQTLSLWANQVQSALGDRASSRSPLKTDPLASGGDLGALNAYVFGVRFGDVTTSSSGQEGAWRLGVTLPVEVLVQELAN